MPAILTSISDKAKLKTWMKPNLKDKKIIQLTHYFKIRLFATEVETKDPEKQSK